MNVSLVIKVKEERGGLLIDIIYISYLSHVRESKPDYVHSGHYHAQVAWVN